MGAGLSVLALSLPLPLPPGDLSELLFPAPTDNPGSDTVRRERRGHTAWTCVSGPSWSVFASKLSYWELKSLPRLYTDLREPSAPGALPGGLRLPGPTPSFGSSGAPPAGDPPAPTPGSSVEDAELGWGTSEPQERAFGSRALLGPEPAGFAAGRRQPRAPRRCRDQRCPEAGVAGRLQAEVEARRGLTARPRTAAHLGARQLGQGLRC